MPAAGDSAARGNPPPLGRRHAGFPRPSAAARSATRAISASAAACPTISCAITRKTASARAISCSARSSTAHLVGAAELRSSEAIWAEQAPFQRHVHAEAAFSVESDYRRRGIGEQLFERIETAASNHGVETIDIVCMPDNVGMIRLAQKFKAHFTFEENMFTGRLTARRPTPSRCCAKSRTTSPISPPRCSTCRCGRSAAA